MSDYGSTGAFMPFRPEFRDAVISGRKTVTSRTKNYGQPGDVLDSTFGPIEIKAAAISRLDHVRDACWDLEGCVSPEDFERVWREIHPRKGFDPMQLVWMHWFRYLGESR